MSRATVSRPRLTWHNLGSEGELYPEWLAVLKSARGCYAIRNARSKRVLYVGSAKANLYATVTRHFQQWKRKKKWWSGQYGAGHDPGMTYDRATHQVAVIVLASNADHLKREAELIEELSPHDNLVERPDGGEHELETVPF